VQECHRTRVIVTWASFNQSLFFHRGHEFAALIGTNDDECPVAKCANSTSRNVGVLGREVWAVCATFASKGVGLFERHFKESTILGPDLEDALDIHLDDVRALDSILGFKEFFENRVVESF